MSGPHAKIDTVALAPMHEEDVQIRASSSCKRELQLRQPGQYVLEVFVPERTQGLSEDLRLVGRVTGSFPLRRLKVEVTVTSNSGALLYKEELAVKQTKRREVVRFDVQRKDLPGTVGVVFSTLALLLPLRFKYMLKHGDCQGEDEEDEGTVGSMEWLEATFKKLPVEDKHRIAIELNRAKERGWAPIHESSSGIDMDHGPGIAEMRRNTEQKRKAHELGLIRPFLLLVSMHPRRRLSWAVSLKVKIYKESEFGDAHWEALRILTASRHGVSSRVSRTFGESLNPTFNGLDWYQICFRVLWKVSSSKKGGAITGLFQSEKMPLEIKEQLEAGKVAAEVSLRYSQQVESRAPIEQLENLFLRQILGAANEQRLNEIVRDLSNSGVLSASDNLDVDVLRAQALEIVQADATLRCKAELLAKHGFDTNAGNHAIAVLCAMRKEVSPVVVEGEHDLLWNAQWGSAKDIIDAEFRRSVELKMRNDNARIIGTTAVPSAVSLVLASLAITPAAVATIMITRGMLQAAHPEVPATVAAFVSGLVMQRLWLALADIDVAVFYTESAAGGDSL